MEAQSSKEKALWVGTKTGIDTRPTSGGSLSGEPKSKWGASGLVWLINTTHPAPPNFMRERDRKVSRVLVMIEYGPGEHDNGDVFDLTELVRQMAPKSTYRAQINFQVECAKEWYPKPVDPANPPAPAEVKLSWGGDAGTWVHGASHLEDVVNSALPDGERVVSLRNKAKRLRKKADLLDHDAMVAKLEQVAAIRAQHPIARVTENLPQISNV